MQACESIYIQLFLLTMQSNHLFSCCSLSIQEFMRILRALRPLAAVPPQHGHYFAAEPPVLGVQRLWITTPPRLRLVPPPRLVDEGLQLGQQPVVAVALPSAACDDQLERDLCGLSVRQRRVAVLVLHAHVGASVQQLAHHTDGMRLVQGREAVGVLRIPIQMDACSAAQPPDRTGGVVCRKDAMHEGVVCATMCQMLLQLLLITQQLNDLSMRQWWCSERTARR